MKRYRVVKKTQQSLIDFAIKKINIRLQKYFLRASIQNIRCVHGLLQSRLEHRTEQSKNEKKNILFSPCSRKLNATNLTVINLFQLGLKKIFFFSFVVSMPCGSLSKILKYSELWPFSFFPLCLCVCTSTRQLEHQNCSRTGRVEKNHKILRKYLINTL